MVSNIFMSLYNTFTFPHITLDLDLKENVGNF